MPRGGTRSGSGRPRTGAKPTTSVRISEALKADVLKWAEAHGVTFNQAVEVALIELVVRERKGRP